ncbi:hypothetical protein CVS47_00521 [Microbacterium lemovicicum]|uniref:DUF3060 domain-containing protein n=1 Tax=Microbacterium lemovicicum TaxID=1072463 RepID=A0A3S9W7J3_9MICO|nr:DUF3060 domain-containing protein [Microbacterium lemovicicum]AZS35923.1 hypothetical protein CVS47_00521 [Microbacterium lemovicicum]
MTRVTPLVPVTAARRVVLSGGALILAVMMAGCAVSLSAPASGTPAGEETAVTPGPTSPAPAPSVPATGSADGPAPSSSPSDDRLTREDLLAAASITIACTPGLVLTEPGAVTRVEGTCEDVTVATDAAYVVLDDASRVTITGSGVVVSALAVDTISIDGDANTVWWTGSAPVVTDSGAGNVIERER